MKKIKTLIVALSIIAIMLLTACSSWQALNDAQIGNAAQGNTSFLASMIYRDFEETAEMATDVVIARYVTRRPFGQNLTEFEFVIQERIFGNAADRIFVYVDHRISTSALRADGSVAEPNFSTGTDYLLMLYKLDSVTSTTHVDGFWFLSNLVLDLNNPSASTIHGEPLTQHSRGMNFNNRNLLRASIVAYVSELTRNNTPSREPIRSDDIKDVITGSSYVLVVEINEPIRLAHQAIRSDLMVATDIYNTTVVRSLKGDMEVGDTVRMIFFADTVQMGERHIIAIEPLEVIEGHSSYFHMFSTRNHSLFRMDQLNEIMEILGLDPELYEGSYEIDIYVSSIGLHEYEYEYDSINNHFSISMFWTDEVDFVPSLYRVGENGIRTRVPDSEIQSVVSVGGSGMDGIGRIPN